MDLATVLTEGMVHLRDGPEESCKSQQYTHAIREQRQRTLLVLLTRSQHLFPEFYYKSL